MDWPLSESIYSAIALSKIFLSSDPRLQTITVKGEIVVNPNAGIVTRSRAKRSKHFVRIHLAIDSNPLLI